MKVAQTGTAIADIAFRALSDPHFTDVPGQCQMFAREVAEAVGGDIGSIMDLHRAGTAYATMLNFRGTKYAIWERRNNWPMPIIQEGDFLYKGELTSGAAGHVGIAANGRRVGLDGSQLIVLENSSYHMVAGHTGNVSKAKGWRLVKDFGPFEMIVRLTQ